MTYPDTLQLAREELYRFFSKKELRSKAARNPVTRASLIQKYHQLHARLVYPFGVPSNVITPSQIVATIKQSK